MIQEIVLANLLDDPQYARRVLPFLKPAYFDDVAARHYRVVFDVISDYATKYGKVPTREAIDVELATRKGFSDETAQAASDLVARLKADSGTDSQWLLDVTEDFCRRKAAYSALMRGYEMVGGDETRLRLDAMHDLWREALSVSFDTELGHDYLEDAEARFAAYKKQEKRVPFDIPILNKITRGGLPGGSLSVVLAATGVGKSQYMGHIAAHQLMMGKNVLYFTLEMSAMEQIGERIDSNLMGVDVRLVQSLDRDVYMAKINAIRAKTKGKLILKEYPTASAGVHHFRTFINELRLKKNFVPEIIYVDYINLCVSSRVRSGSDVNSYTVIKMIAEELRGLAMELDVPVVTATQTNRSGFNNTDIDLTNTADSIGLPQTADFMIALISTEELEQKGQLQVKQLKNRWAGIVDYGKFMLGIDRSRMRLYEIDGTFQPQPTRQPTRLDAFAGFK